MDASSLALIIKLQLEDSEELAFKAKGKQPEGCLSDAELALRLYTEELDTCDVVLSDKKMAESMASAVILDGPLVQHCHEQEQQAASDRDLATRFQRNGTSAMAAPLAITDGHEQAEADDIFNETEMLSKLAAIYLGDPIEPSSSTAMVLYGAVPGEDSDSENVAESSSSAVARQKRRQLSQCAACGDQKEFYTVARVPCGHEYCRPCLAELFQLSMTDESLFPPRCDRQVISLSRVRFFLPADLVKAFETKSLELSTKDRLYCHVRTCSAFIPPQVISNDVGTCQECGEITCSMCKAATHTGDCPEDYDLKMLLDTANGERWQRCYQCKRLVELTMGCYHMSCPCGAHFCYACGVPWKKCNCPQWDEDRLYARGVQLVDRAPQAGGVNRAHQIAAAMNHLERNHECLHERWRSVGGQHDCEECGNTMPMYIRECRQCHLRACGRCCRNRL